MPSLVLHEAYESWTMIQRPLHKAAPSIGRAPFCAESPETEERNKYRSFCDVPSENLDNY